MKNYFETVLNKEMIAELGLRLLNRDMLNDESLMELTQDIADFVRSLIKNRNKTEVLSFLQEHKDHMTPDMREIVSKELKSLTPGKI